jgi:uncharacterized protein YwgA
MSSDGLVGLLKLVEASGGSLDTRIRIQKEAFLLALKGYRHFRPQSFVYHHYGPFSREVSDAVQSAVSGGLLEEREEIFPDGSKKYSYHLSDAGRAFSDDEVLSDVVREYAAFLGKQHWRALELAATVAYLEARKRISSREDAFAMAEKLKPETVQHAANARKILQELRI